MSELYSHIAVLVSIVIALGMAELVTAWGDLLRNRQVVTFYWTHAFWTVFILVMMIQFWWGFWNFNSNESWTIISLTTLVFQNLLVVLTAQMLAPKIAAGQPANMKEFFYSNSKLFFLLAAMMLVCLTLNDIFLLNLPLWHSENLVRAIGTTLCLISAFSQNERIHIVMAMTATVLFAIFLAFG